MNCNPTLTNSMQQGPFQEAYDVQLIKKFTSFYRTDSLSRLQEPTTGDYTTPYTIPHSDKLPTS
jgi:hypothetical protein